jgi:hypothetical protein
MDFYDSVYYDNIKSDLQQKSGVFMNNFSDAYLLSAAMESNKFSISPHTLARFFDIIPRRKIYPSTLQIICNYLGFEHFESYRKFVQSSHSRILLGTDGYFFDSMYSLQSFELAIQLMSETEIRAHLECIDFSNTNMDALAYLVGYLVRNSSDQHNLLKILASTVNGRRIFYEHFVDEDDPNGYFSSALQTNCLELATTCNNRIFYYCYLISNSSYQNRSIDSSWIVALKKEILQIDYSKLHFHEISRVFETRILIDFHPNNLIGNKIISIIDEMLMVTQTIEMHAQSWILARFLKALSFRKQLFFAMQNKSICSLVTKIYKCSKIESIGELIIQFVYFRFLAKLNNELNPPIRLESDYFQNEYNTRLSVETATRSLMCNSIEQKMLLSSLDRYSLKTGTSWVLNVLYNS